MRRHSLLVLTALVALSSAGCIVVSPHGHGRHAIVNAPPPGHVEHEHRAVPPGQAKKDCSHGHSKWCDDRD